MWPTNPKKVVSWTFYRTNIMTIKIEMLVMKMLPYDSWTNVKNKNTQSADMIQQKKMKQKQKSCVLLQDRHIFFLLTLCFPLDFFLFICSLISSPFGAGMSLKWLRQSIFFYFSRFLPSLERLIKLLFCVCVFYIARFSNDLLNKCE